ncbi:DUF4249 family protein [Maribacter algarum]|uniref:DUF4249 family protein n=1 Tax=Maribacter algarum (ex Zhang et al. 2020) TaxID=2578118 RepID=A0A5S3PQT6_9FLAO|nr:DUF4249 domain-containing protein [Maribacter algarum]TMM57106.1 DUF4249 family protein [Maribacter algarum]
MKRYFMYLGGLLSLSACVESFDFETRESSGILVVEATITDKVDTQLVVLSRSANLEKVNIPERDSLDVRGSFEASVFERTNPEGGASVKIVSQSGIEFSFNERGDGVYESLNEFGLEASMQYQLQITTRNGETYESEFRGLSGKSRIDNIYAERGFNAQGEEGMLIFADGTNTTSESDYFRYSYEETYKIIAPTWTSMEFEVLQEELETINDTVVLYPKVRLVERSEEEQICYTTKRSQEINLASTLTSDASDIKRHVVRFINRNDPMLSHRYSILLKQFVVDNNAHSYYTSLLDFSQQENVFTEIQPGFLEGNLKRTDIDEGKVIGYFEVASIAEKRFFFNYEDFFPNEELPPYFGDINCGRFISPALGDPELDGPQPLGCPGPTLVFDILSGRLEYATVNADPGDCEGPYFMTFQACGDCTVFGSNIKPDFWED